MAHSSIIFIQIRIDYARKRTCVSWMYQLLALNCLPEEEEEEKEEEGGGRGDANEHHYQPPPDCPECKVLLTFSALASIVHVSLSPPVSFSPSAAAVVERRGAQRREEERGGAELLLLLLLLHRAATHL